MKAISLPLVLYQEFGKFTLYSILGSPDDSISFLKLNRSAARFGEMPEWPK